MKHRDAHSLLTILLSAGFGVLAGMRSMAVPALLSRHLSSHTSRSVRAAKVGGRSRVGLLDIGRAAATDVSARGPLRLPSTLKVSHPIDGEAVVSLLSRPAASTALTGMAAGEMVTDKLPFAPNRTELPSLAARTAIGALSAAVIAEYRGHRLLPATLVGAAAAFGATHTSFHLRRIFREVTPVPDALLGVLEDLFVLRAGRRLTGLLDA